MRMLLLSMSEYPSILDPVNLRAINHYGMLKATQVGNGVELYSNLDGVAC